MKTIRILFTKVISVCFIIMLMMTQLNAQKLPDVSKISMPEKNMNIPSCLYQLYANVNEKGMPKQEAISNKGLISNLKGEVNVIIENISGKEAFSKDMAEAEKATWDASWRNYTSIYLDPEKIKSFYENLPKNYKAEPAYPPDFSNEGPAFTKSNSYIAAGGTGEDFKIGIIDGGWQLYGDALDEDAVPVEYENWNFTPNGFFTETQHGTACTETVFDHVPDADYLLFKVSNLVHLGNAVDTCINRGVHVISHSMSWGLTPWNDNEGAACEAVSNATANDMLFFVAAGNYAQRHWKGFFSDADGNDFHEWEDEDESNGVIIPGNGRLRVMLRWDTNPGITDLDLIITDIDSNILGISNSGGNTFEIVTLINPSPQNAAVYIWVQKFNGDINPEMQLVAMDVPGPFEHVVSEGSILSPSNSTESNCLVVGAVHIENYENGIIESYSSRGPTNNGNIKPDISGPTGTTTVAYGGSFTGTSCSTPNLAGTAVALWSTDTELESSAIRYLLLEMAGIYNDWGDQGQDNIFGIGGSELMPYANNTLWVDRRYNNQNGNRNAPYYFVEDAMDAAVTGGRLIFFGQSYPENVLMDKPILIQSLHFNATLGN